MKVLLTESLVQFGIELKGSDEKSRMNDWIRYPGKRKATTRSQLWNTCERVK